MAISKKGWRRLRVGESDFRWRMHIGYGESRYTYLVAGESAFVAGTHGPVLRFAIETMDPESNLGAYEGPRVVRFAIEAARRRSPPFTGRPGGADVTLTTAEARAVNETAFHAPTRRLLQTLTQRRELNGLHCELRVQTSTGWRFIIDEEIADGAAARGPFRLLLERRLRVHEGRGVTTYRGVAEAADLHRAVENALVELDRAMDEGRGFTRLTITQ